MKDHTYHTYKWKVVTVDNVDFFSGLACECGAEKDMDEIEEIVNEEQFK